MIISTYIVVKKSEVGHLNKHLLLRDWNLVHDR